MARSHGKLLCSIWEDDDFLALPAGAQRLYMLLISQRKTTMVGCLDLKPARWARLAPDTTIDDIRQAARQLHDARFIVLDEETDELVVRTLVRHDGVRATANSNLLKGFWSAWESIESPTLRRVVIAHIPDDVWEAKKYEPPVAALEMRRSDPPEPPVPTAGSNQERELVPTNGSDPRSEPRGRAPSTFHLPPSNVRSSSSAVTSTGAEPEPVDDDDRRASAPPSERVAAVAKLVGERDHAEAVADDVDIPEPRAHKRKCIRNRQRDAALADLVHRHLELTDREIADLVPPWFVGEAPPSARHLAAVPPPEPDPACPDCHGEGRFLVDATGQGTVQECDCKYRREAS
jgi:hypothetical protein